MRLKIIRVFIIILFLMIAGGLFFVQVIRGKFFYNLSAHNRIRVVPTEGWRGRVFDRNGVLMADNQASYNVTVIPQEIRDKDQLFAYLAGILKKDKRKLLGNYQKRKLAPFAPVTVAENISREQAIMIEENKYRYPCLLVQESFLRRYPLGANSAHVLGYVGEINRSQWERVKEYGYTPQSIIGYSGVEEYYDEYLKGGTGGSQVEVNSQGKQVRLLSLKEPVKGQDIRLTVDAELQAVAAKLLEDRTGAVVIMDMDTGEILSLASGPDYNPNIFTVSRNQRKLQRLFSHPDAPFLNRAIKGAFPPGSVFKVPVAIAALDLKKIKPSTTIFCQGFLNLAGATFGCTHVHGEQNLIQALAHSCNVYFYRTGLMVGADMIQKYAHMIGLGKKTFIDLPYEKKGNIPSRSDHVLSGKKWYSGYTLNLSIGQGDILVTPLQLTRMISTVGNRGVEVRPHVIQAIGGAEVQEYPVTKKSRISPEIFDDVNQGLRAAVKSFSGTAHILEMEGVKVYAKTGTAQSGKSRAHHAWVAGYAKSTKSNIAFCVFIEHGGSSQNACVLARQLLLKMKEEQIL